MKKTKTFESLSYPQQVSEMTKALVLSSLFLIREGSANTWQKIEMADGKEYFALLLPTDKWEILDGRIRLKAIGKLEEKETPP